MSESKFDPPSVLELLFANSTIRVLIVATVVFVVVRDWRASSIVVVLWCCRLALRPTLSRSFSGSLGALDPEPPFVLFLRSFERDGQYLDNDWWSFALEMNALTLTPVVALANPDDFFPGGLNVIRCSDNWREDFLSLASRASSIVVLPGEMTDGIRWELESLLEIEAAERTSVVIPWSADDDAILTCGAVVSLEEAGALVLRQPYRKYPADWLPLLERIDGTKNLSALTPRRLRLSERQAEKHIRRRLARIHRRTQGAPTGIERLVLWPMSVKLTVVWVVLVFVFAVIWMIR